MRTGIIFIFFLTALCQLSLAQQNWLCLNEQIRLTETRDIPNPLSAFAGLKNTSPKYINTVVHVVYNQFGNSVSQQEVEWLLEEVNTIFRAENVDLSEVHPAHHDKLMDSQIQFCLANQDPLGNMTSGITYTSTTVSGFDNISLDTPGLNEAVKSTEQGGADPWDTSQYLNIWIAEVEDEYTSASYAIPQIDFFPLGMILPENAIPGVVLDIDRFFDEFLILNTPQVLAHECGHALGLMHTFDDTANGLDCDTSNDYIDDTPTCNVTFICNVNQEHNTCIAAVDDEPDHAENIMNYACMLMFTPNQIDAMHANLSLATGWYESSACGVIADITTSAAEHVEWVLTPNPNNGSFEVILPEWNDAHAGFSIYNSMGQMVFQTEVDFTTSHSLPIHKPDMMAGVYYAKLESDRNTSSKAIIIH